MRRAVTALIVAAVVLAACGGGGKAAKDRAKVASITTTSLAPSTTAAPTAAVSPLTGLPVADAGKAGRVALIVKIDNAPEARPQAGLVEADVVYEEMVEGGITRLAAVYQSTDAKPVGPVRSARTTDVNIASELNHPLYGYSGGNKIFLAAIARAPLPDVGVDPFDSLYPPARRRPAPRGGGRPLRGHLPPRPQPPGAAQPVHRHAGAVHQGADGVAGAATAVPVPGQGHAARRRGRGARPPRRHRLPRWAHPGDV